MAGAASPGLTATNLAKAEKEKQMGLCAKRRATGETRPGKQRVGACRRGGKGVGAWEKAVAFNAFLG